MTDEVTTPCPACGEIGTSGEYGIACQNDDLFGDGCPVVFYKRQG